MKTFGQAGDRAQDTVNDSSSSVSRDGKPPAAGRAMHALATELFPICRSITGDGLRATLRRIQQEIPLTIHEVPSGTQVLDWTIPDEWNIREAWIMNSRGERVVDFQRHNLHVVNYSAPVRARMSLAELKPHLHTSPDHPNWIPYRTTYYRRDWGFCLAQRQLELLEEDRYDVCIDSTLAPGSLSYGESFIRGETEDEFLISCHCCHPSLANDNLSGVAVAVALEKELRRRGGLRRSYRFLFIPATIGAITWLARNEETIHRIQSGLVLTCLGDSENITYKKSRRGDAAIDRAAQRALKESGAPHLVIDFFPFGYDERQYCSPGFDLPVGCFMRSRHGTFPEYHTSADNLEFICPAALEDSFQKLLSVIRLSEDGPAEGNVTCETSREAGNSIHDPRFTIHDRRYLNLKPRGEPQLGKYGVYEALGRDVLPALWVLNLSDGQNSLSRIATRAKLPFDSIANAADVLLSRGLLKEVDPSIEAV